MVADTALVLLFVLVGGFFAAAELAPKRLALQHAEHFSLLVAGLLDRIAWASRPVIWLLSRSTNLVVRAAGGDPHVSREEMTEEELRDVVAANASLSGEERRLIQEVFDAGERALSEVMVPRTEVDFLDASLTVEEAAGLVNGRERSRCPVVRGSHDDVVGFVHVRDLLAPRATGRTVRLAEIAREVMRIPGTREVLAALQDMRRSGAHLAIVVDEYGGTDGIVTLEDLVEELVGEIGDEYDKDVIPTRRLLGGAVQVDGLLNLDDFADRTGTDVPHGPYETVAGYVMTMLGRIPAPGDHVDADGYRFTVVEMDGRRIARLQVAPASASTPAPASGTVGRPPG